MFGTDYYAQVYPGGTAQVLQPLSLTYAMSQSVTGVNYAGRSDATVSMDVEDGIVSMDPEMVGSGVS